MSETIDDIGNDSQHLDDCERIDDLRYILTEKDRYLPIANIGKIMKRTIPDSAKLTKEARECVQECTSEFISFITSEANERSMREGRKVINIEDILVSMKTLGFDNYIEPLRIYMKKYREAYKNNRLLSDDLLNKVLQNSSRSSPTNDDSDETELESGCAGTTILDSKCTRTPVLDSGSAGTTTLGSGRGGTTILGSGCTGTTILGSGCGGTTILGSGCTGPNEAPFEYVYSGQKSYINLH